MNKVNSDLKRRILSKVPKEGSPILGCLIIYSELCKTLEYSLDYYFRPDQVVDYYKNPENLSDIDGTVRKDITCYTFNAIFIDIVKTAYPLVSVMPVKTEDGSELFLDEHQFATITIDDVSYNFDPIQGILDDNDLMDMKFCGRKIKGVSIDHIPQSIERKHSEIDKELKEAIDHVNNLNDQNLNLLVTEYIEKEGKVLKMLPIEERFDLFLKLVELAPPMAMATFNYYLTVKNALFTEQETNLDYEGKDVQYFQMSFVYDTISEEPKVLIFFNANGFERGEQGYNQDQSTLQVYDISVNSGEIKKVSVEDVADNGRYITRYGKPVRIEENWIVKL